MPGSPYLFLSFGSGGGNAVVARRLFAGTLLRTFVLIPTIASRHITYIFGATLAGCAVLLFVAPARRRAGV